MFASYEAFFAAGAFVAARGVYTCCAVAGQLKIANMLARNI